MGGHGQIDYQYKHFKATVPERRTFVGIIEQLEWRYYDTAPKSGLPPLVCLGGVAATSDVFYKQMLALSTRGYRVLALDAPALWTHEKWIKGFDHFLDSLRIHQVHLYGTSLGGFLFQLYAQHRPRRVLSLVLSNTFLDTRSFNAFFGPWSTMFPWAPDFMLKRLVLSGFKEGPHEPLIADSIDFVVARMDQKLMRAELASRLALNTQLAAASPVQLPDAAVTIMDCNDFASVPGPLRDALYQRYPEARRAFLKSGGDFPFLSRADEVNLHLLLHLRRVLAAHEGPQDEDILLQQQQAQQEQEEEDTHFEAGPSASSRIYQSGSDLASSAMRGEDLAPDGALERSSVSYEEAQDGAREGKAGLERSPDGSGSLDVTPLGGRVSGTVPLGEVSSGDPLGVSSGRTLSEAWEQNHERRFTGGGSTSQQDDGVLSTTFERQLRVADPGTSSDTDATEAKDVHVVHQSSWADKEQVPAEKQGGSLIPDQEVVAVGTGEFLAVPVEESPLTLGTEHSGNSPPKGLEDSRANARAEVPQHVSSPSSPPFKGDDGEDVGSQAREWLSGVEAWDSSLPVNTQARDWLRDVEKDHS